MFDGQFYPFQPIQFMDGLLVPPIGGGDNLTSFTLFGTPLTGTDSSIEISAIGSLQANDLCLIWNAADGGGSTPDTTPSGFTQLATGDNGRRASISAKRLDGTETTVTGISSGSMRWICLILRPNAPWTNFTNHLAGSVGGGANPDPQIIAALTDGAVGPLVMWGSMYSNAAINPRNAADMTEIAGAATNHYGHYRLFASGDARVDQSYDMDDEGTNIMASGYLTFT